VRDGVLAAHDHLASTGTDVAALRAPEGLLEAAELRQAAGRLEAIAAAFGALDHQTATTEANRDTLVELARTLRSCVSEPRSADEIARMADEARVAARGSEDVKQLAADARCELERVKERAIEGVVRPHGHAFLELLRRFEAAHRVAKAERGALDFTDLPLKTERLLVERPDIAAELADSFASLIVDEYQDTDPLQTSIVSRISQDDLCTVGDAQQSIYAWRFADVEVFRRRRDAVDPGDRAELTINYRSHPDIVAFANHVFSHGPLRSPDHLVLRPDRDASDRGVLPAPMARVRLDLTACDKDDGDPRGTEAAVLASRVRELLDGGVIAAQLGHDHPQDFAG
jgi:ATP-dependent exoDNAse (exonuclease V) beta subunit